MTQQTVCLDFDGVLHSYTSGWQGPSVVADPPLQSGVALAWMLKGRGFRVVVQSTRAETEEGRRAILAYLEEHEIPFDELAERKPKAVAYVDDRAVAFRPPESVVSVVAAIEALAAGRPERMPLAEDCPDQGRCHGSMNWCDACGDVSNVCDMSDCAVHGRGEWAGSDEVPFDVAPVPPAETAPKTAVPEAVLSWLRDRAAEATQRLDGGLGCDACDGHRADPADDCSVVFLAAAIDAELRGERREAVGHTAGVLHRMLDRKVRERTCTAEEPCVLCGAATAALPAVTDIEIVFSD